MCKRDISKVGVCDLTVSLMPATFVKIPIVSLMPSLVFCFQLSMTAPIILYPILHLISVPLPPLLDCLEQKVAFARKEHLQKQSFFPTELETTVHHWAGTDSSDHGLEPLHIR